jgi:archaellum biogenesis ATPase FlaH
VDEVKLLGAVLHDRKTFAVLDKFISSSDLSDRGQVVYAEIQRWYETDSEATSCDAEVLAERIISQHPKHEAVFRAILDRSVPVSSKNILGSFLEFKAKAVGSQLIQALAAGDSRKADALAQEYRDLVGGKVEVLEKDRKVYIKATSEKLVESVRPENLMQLHPKELNDALGGGLPRGAHVLIFAPPEVGKSLLSINIASGFLHDGRRVLYLGNEDPAELMLLRFKSRLSGMVRGAILANPDKADGIASQHGFDNLIFVSLSPGSVRDIEQLCDEYQPDVVVCDQLSNIYAPNLSKVEGLEWLAKQMRNICKSRNIVGISITQAADSAQNKLVLDMGDVYFSNVAIQAQVDVMIGIGMDKTAEAAGIRVLSLCKNKLNGNHVPVQVQVIPELSKVRG